MASGHQGLGDSAQGRAVLNLLGLAARARQLISGTESVRGALREGAARYVLLAADAAEGQTDKVVPLLRAVQVPYHTAFTREELGHAIGRSPVTAVAVTNEQFARRVGPMVAALPSMRE